MHPLLSFICGVTCCMCQHLTLQIDACSPYVSCETAHCVLNVLSCGAGTGAQGKADATWIFLGHEGVQAEMEGVRLNVFQLSDYDIPYGFTPILVGNPETMRSARPSCFPLLWGGLQLWCEAW